MNLIQVFIIIIAFPIIWIVVSKVSKISAFSFSKFISEKKLGIGTVEKSGQVVYSWIQPSSKAELYIFLHFKKYVLIGVFIIFIILYSLLIYPLFQGIIGVCVSFLASIISVFLFIFMLWLGSKIDQDSIVCEILTEGIYIRNIIPINVFLTGLFVPYSKLESPKFDDRNHIIILKFKNKRFLRRFVVCTQENYKQVSEYIRSKIN